MSNIIRYIKLSIPNILKYRIKYLYKLVFLFYSKEKDSQFTSRYQARQMSKNFNQYKKIRRLSEAINFSSIDITSKQDYSSSNSYLSNSKFKTYKTNTGGTTGAPLVMYKSRNDLAYEAAFIDYYLKLCGVSIFSPYKSIRIRGERLNGWCRRNGYNKVSLSSYHINEDSCLSYWEYIEEFKPEVIFCYPSSLYLLCKELDAIEFLGKVNLKAIVFSSETLHQYQVKVIKKYFDSKLLNLFGNTEHTILAVNWLEGKGFEINPYYSYVENIEGRLVSSSFNDKNMPFIRYFSDDTISVSPDGYVQLEGRIQDFAIGLSGQKFPLVGLIFGQHFELFELVKEMRIRQNKVGEIILEYYSYSPVSSDILKETRQIISDVTNGDIIVDFYHSNTFLPRTNAGKLKFFTSEI